MYIYGEEFIFINLAANFVVASVVAENLQVKSKLLRATASSFIGLIFIIILICFKLPYPCFLIKILASSLMCVPLIYPKISLRKYVCALLMLVFSSAICSGCIILVTYLFDASFIQTKISCNIFTFIFGLVLGRSINTVCLKMLRNTFLYKCAKHTCLVEYDDVIIKDIIMFADTGNIATDKLGNPVLFLSEEIFESIVGFTPISLHSYDEYLKFIVALPEKKRRRLDALKFSTVVSSDWTISFRADRIVFDNGNVIISPVLSCAKCLNGKEYNGIYNPNKITQRS